MAAPRIAETLHLITGEYPPDRGGVSGYTAEVARGLVADGTSVHVWCPGREPVMHHDGVFVHRALGRITGTDLRKVSAEMDAVAGPRRLIVQWVPHAFGRRSLNLAFCRWIRRRSQRGDTVEIMVHEPFLEFSWSPRRAVAAVVHRVMTRILLRATTRVWVSTPAWEACWRPFAPSHVPFAWLPVPATVPVNGAARASGTDLRRVLAPVDGCVIGSFSPAGPFVQQALSSSVAPVVAAHAGTALLLVGSGSVHARSALIAQHPGIADRVHATGLLDAGEVSRHLGACDLAVQPCADGVCTRHSSVATLLAHGVPVITTEGRFTESLWREASAVALVPADDPGALRRQVEALVGDSEARLRLAGRGTALYDSRLHIRHTVAAFRSGRVQAIA